MKKGLGIAAALALLAAPPILAQESGGDRIEPDGCAGCHVNAGMAEVVMWWETSQHAKSYDWGAGANTYCAECKSPQLWDPEATRDDNDPIDAPLWQDVTCASCHPPHHERVEWGTPMGVIVDPTAEDPHVKWQPIYDRNELCLHCHSGPRHAKEFQGFGAVMYEKKGVTCVDCHMPDIPNPAEGENRDQVSESHSWLVFDTLPYSCGIGEAGCHANKKEEWAAKQLAKQKIHGKK